MGYKAAAPARRAGSSNGGLASQHTIDALQARIASGELAHGSRLPPQRGLAKSLGVSRATLREALSVMETLGMLRVEPRKGVFVRGPTDKSPSPQSRWRFGERYSEREVFELRYTLEGTASRLSALSKNTAYLEDLAESVAAMKAAAREQLASRFADADFSFHHAIVKAAGNRLLVDMHAGLRPLVIETQRLPLAYPAEFWDPIHEHEQVFEALRLRDPDGAAYLMRLHLTRAAERSGTAFRT